MVIDKYSNVAGGLICTAGAVKGQPVLQDLPQGGVFSIGRSDYFKHWKTWQHLGDTAANVVFGFKIVIAKVYWDFIHEHLHCLGVGHCRKRQALLRNYPGYQNRKD